MDWNAAGRQATSIPKDVVTIGAGPAGLTAGYLLAKERVPVTILEADPDYVRLFFRPARSAAGDR